MNAPQTHRHAALVVGPPAIWPALSQACSGLPWKLRFVRTHGEAMSILDGEDRSPELVFLNVPSELQEGLRLLAAFRRRFPSAQIVVFETRGDVDDAISYVKAGAFNYLSRPLRLERIAQILSQALQQPDRKVHVRRIRMDDPLAQKMGPSRLVQGLIWKLDRVAKTDMSVVIQGESGTGKELVSRSIHERSHRADGPFVAVDCGALPANLIESTLFGAQKGSYTGSDRERQGVFRAANGGTLFLDEIGNLPLAQQSRLLRVLQERAVTPVGSCKPEPINVRVIAATNAPLEELVAKGEFRLDLFHRLQDFPITLPPLRERPDDLLYLARRFAREAAEEFGREEVPFSDDAVQLMMAMTWEGNVRELRSTVRRACLMADEQIGPELLGAAPPGATTSQLHVDHDGIVVNVRCVVSRSGEGLPYKRLVDNVVRNVEQTLITQALQTSRGNKSKAARMLGLSYRTILNKLRDFEVEEDVAV